MSGKKAKAKCRELKTEGRIVSPHEIKNKKVNLSKAVEILDTVITESLCETIFKRLRTKERRRAWSLHAMVKFWNAVILHAPVSLRQALEEAGSGEGTQWPEVETSPEAFFQRSQNMSWRFFAALYGEFGRRMEKLADLGFAQEFQYLLKRFSQVYLIDGSALDAIKRLLKGLRQEPATVLPGSILAAYDLFRGYAPILGFFENARESEMRRLETILEKIPQGSLLIADRIYATAKLFGILAEKNLYALFRRHASLSLRRIRRVSRKRLPGGVLEDWLVQAGSGWNGTDQPMLRWIIFRSKKLGDYEFLTNVLDPRQLSAEEAMELYRCRWDVERLFYDIKEVLNLHRFYAGNVNAVAMQVYAAAMTHTAMRTAQSRIARQAGIGAEAISTAKFFPRMAAAVYRRQMIKFGAQIIKEMNPEVTLKEPHWDRLNAGSVRLHQILVEPRKESPPRKDLRIKKNKSACKSLHLLTSHGQN